MRQPCLDCGELTREPSRCADCAEAHAQITAPRLPDERVRPAAARGYDRQWRLLSERARRLQPFCSDCGTKHDLQADHTPEAWRRRARGLAVRLKDIDVVCGPCNRARGAARGESATRRS